jgi:hypothetical protein
MANVRIDQNGLSKGAVYEWTEPVLHRSNVTAPDAEDPVGTANAVDSGGYQCCRFDIAISGAGFVSLEVQVLFWNSRQGKWFGGAKYEFTEIGQHAIVAEVRGAIVFLKVTAFSGTSLSLDADYSLS